MLITNNSIKENTSTYRNYYTKSFTSYVDVTDTYNANEYTQAMYKGFGIDLSVGTEERFDYPNNSEPYYITITGTKTENGNTTNISGSSVVYSNVTTTVVNENDYYLNINIAGSPYRLWFNNKKNEQRAITFNLTVKIDNAWLYAEEKADIVLDGNVYIKELI